MITFNYLDISETLTINIWYFADACLIDVFSIDVLLYLVSNYSKHIHKIILCLMTFLIFTCKCMSVESWTNIHDLKYIYIYFMYTYDDFVESNF